MSQNRVKLAYFKTNQPKTPQEIKEFLKLPVEVIHITEDKNFIYIFYRDYRKPLSSPEFLKELNEVADKSIKTYVEKGL